MIRHVAWWVLLAAGLSLDQASKYGVFHWLGGTEQHSYSVFAIEPKPGEEKQGFHLVAQFKEESALAREDAQPQLRNPQSKPRKERPWLAALMIGAIAAGFIGWQAWQDRPQDPRLETVTTARSAPTPAESDPLDGHQWS